MKTKAFTSVAQITVSEILECGPYIDLKIVRPF